MEKLFKSKIYLLIVGLLVTGGGLMVSVPSASAALTSISSVTPDGGEVIGSTYTISWTSNPSTPTADTVNLYYCKGADCGTLSYTLIAAGEANDGSYDWDTTTAAGDDDN